MKNYRLSERQKNHSKEKCDTRKLLLLMRTKIAGGCLGCCFKHFLWRKGSTLMKKVGAITA